MNAYQRRKMALRNMEKYLYIVYLIKGASEVLNRSNDIINWKVVFSSAWIKAETGHCSISHEELLRNRTSKTEELSDASTSVHKIFQKPSTSASTKLMAKEKQMDRGMINQNLRLVLVDTCHKNGNIFRRHDVESGWVSPGPVSVTKSIYSSKFQLCKWEIR